MKVHLEKTGDAFTITRIDLATEADVPNVHPDGFQQHALTAKQTCPVSKVLSGAEITLDARLVGQGAAGRPTRSPSGLGRSFLSSKG